MRAATVPRTPVCRRTRPALELARRLRNDFLHVAGLSLPRPAPLGQERRALHSGQVIQEEHAVEVIDFMLHGACLVPGDLHTVRLAVAIEGLERDIERPLDFGEEV